MARRRTRRPRMVRGRRRRRDMTKGQVLRPRRTPPEIIQAPKNQLSVTFRFTGTASFNQAILISDITTASQGQIGIAKESHLVFQILSVSAWEMAGNQLLLGAMDLLEPGTEELQVIEDQPGRNQWATVGYRWPRAHQQVVFDSDTDKDRKICFLAGPTAAVAYNCFVRLRLLWRGAQRINPRLAAVREKLSQQNAMVY